MSQHSDSWQARGVHIWHQVLTLPLAIENFRTNYSNWLEFKRQNSDDVSNEENLKPHPMRSLEVGGAKAGSFTVHELIGAQVLSVWNFSLFSLSRLPSEPQDALLPIWISSCLLGFPPSAPGNLVVSPVLGVTLGGFWAGSLPVAQTWPSLAHTCVVRSWWSTSSIPASLSRPIASASHS